MDPAWKNKPSPGEQAKRAKAVDAYHAGCWIYVPERDKWYSPEEFMKSAESVGMYHGKDNADRFKVRDPRAGILEKLQRIEQLQQELKEFTRRVLDYYDLKRKK